MLPIIWMSPGNSYFKDKEFAFLLREAIKKFGKAVVMVADIPAISTYLAMWYNPSKARSKAVLKGNNLKNLTKRVIDSMGLDSSKVFIVDRDADIKNNTHYLHSFALIQDLYQANNAFAEAVNKTSTVVLQNAQVVCDEKNIKDATHYLLSEFAFLEFASDYFGVNQVGYFYHKNRFVFEDYIAGLFDWQVKSYLQFVLLENPYEMYITTEKEMSRWETIQQRWIIRCSFVPYFHYFQEKKTWAYSWIMYSLIEQFAKKHSLEVEFVEQTWYGTLADRLNNWSIDVFCSPTRPTKQRKLEMFFSQSIFESQVRIYMNTRSRYYGQDSEILTNNEKLRIAVKDNDVHHDLAKEYFPYATLVRIPQLSHIGEVIDRVIEQRADLTFWDEELCELYMKEKNYDPQSLQKIKRNEWAIGVYSNCFALPWWEFELKRMIDECIVS